MSAMLDEYQEAKTDVFCLLGRCVVASQAYETLLKFIIKRAEDLALVQKSKEDFNQALTSDLRTLGALVNEFVNSFEENAEGVFVHHRLGFEDGKGNSVNCSLQIPYPGDDLGSVKHHHLSIVRLRNEVIHNFLNIFDISTLDGCIDAKKYLINAIDRMKQHHKDLSEWLQNLNSAYGEALEVFKSEQFRDLVISASPQWKHSEIMDAFKGKSQDASDEGWASLAETVDAISGELPGVKPTDYECRSWRQLLHESGFFELRYRQQGSKRVLWYRVKSAD